jgi:hypothetical protein
MEITTKTTVIDIVSSSEIPNARGVFLDVCFCNFSDEISVSEQNMPLLNADVHHNAYDIDISFDDARSYNLL